MSTQTEAPSTGSRKGLLALGTLPVACTVIVAINGLYIFLVALGNITDFDTNQAFVQHVLAMDTINFGAGEGVNIDQDVAWRAIESPLIQNIAYIGVIIWETLAAVVLLASVWLWLRAVRARRGNVAQQGPARQPFAHGILFGLTNPKAYPVAVATFTALLSSRAELLTWAMLPWLIVLSFVGGAAAYVILIGVVGAGHVRALYQRHELLITRLCGVMFIGFAISALMHALPGLLASIR